MQKEYRKGVGLMIMNKDRKVFVAKRLDTFSDAWQMPQGGIDENEDPKDAALREMLEEIGTNNATIIASSKKWYSYDFPAEYTNKLFAGKYQGQSQLWFLMQYNGTDADINLTAHTPEFSDWQWIDMKELPQLIVPFKRKLYLDVIDEFEPLIL